MQPFLKEIEMANRKAALANQEPALPSIGTETESMTAVMAALDGLTSEAKRRVLAWADGRVVEETKADNDEAWALLHEAS
jgi:hypothetical protein